MISSKSHPQFEYAIKGEVAALRTENERLRGRVLDLEHQSELGEQENERLRAELQESASLKDEYIAGHNKLAERVGLLENALRNFSNPANWYERPGCQQWMGKLDAVYFAESVLNQQSTPQVKE